MLIIRSYIAENTYFYEVPEHLEEQARLALDEQEPKALYDIIDQCNVSVDDDPRNMIAQSLVETNALNTIPGSLIPVSRKPSYHHAAIQAIKRGIQYAESHPMTKAD